MDKVKNIELITKNKIVAIIRADVSEGLEEVIETLFVSGIKVLEVSFNTPGALKLIKRLSKKYEDEMLIGAGTVIDSETAVRAISVGAKFIISPVYKQDMVKTCLRYNVISVPGVLTPTEALAAYEAGADFVKLFPAGNLGPGYIKAIKAPLPQLLIIPVGGINLNNAKAFLDSGAVAVAAGSSLVSKRAIENKDHKMIEENAKRFIECVGNSGGLR